MNLPWRMVWLMSGVAALGAAQSPETATGYFELAQRHYAARRLGDAETALIHGVELMRQERAAHAADPPPTGLAAGSPLPVGGVVGEPVRTRDAVPQFSIDAVRAGASGMATVEFVVTRKGSVDRVRILKSVAQLDDAVLAAARRWRYEPTRVDGQPVDVLTVAAMSFRWRTDPLPADDLEMARFYCERRHYAHAEERLARALAAIREEALTFGVTAGAGPARVNAPFAGRGTGGAVAGEIREPRKTKDVVPIYPQAAFAAKVQGTVLLEAVIDRQGLVRDVRVLKSIPALDQAALDAVRQWVYTPPLLNGTPVAVVMTVTVVFALR